MENLALISWNVGRYNNKIHEYIKNVIMPKSPDILFLSETKMSEENLKKKLSEFDSDYVYIINSHVPHWFHGVAMLIRRGIDYIRLPIDLGIKPRYDSKDSDPCTGRVISVLISGKIAVVGAYIPNAGNGDATKLSYRIDSWDIAMHESLNMLKSLFSKVIWIGDINVALEEIDVSNPEYMYKYAGFTPLERKSLSMFLSNGWVDIWRHQHPDKVEYSWIGAKKTRRENHGMRLDNIIVTNTIDIDNSSSYIMSDFGCDSDHVPVGANIITK